MPTYDGWPDLEPFVLSSAASPSTNNRRSHFETALAGFLNANGHLNRSC